jgi:hypothetical protein
MRVVESNDLKEGKAGGDGGIRTLDRALQPYNGLANRRLQPLGHISGKVDMPDAGASRKRQISVRRIPGDLTAPGLSRALQTVLVVTTAWPRKCGGDSAAPPRGRRRRLAGRDSIVAVARCIGIGPVRKIEMLSCLK